jgi:hypothetical protein
VPPPFLPMTSEFDYPIVLALISLVVLWLAGWFGYAVLRRKRGVEEGVSEDFSVVLGATLALTGLIIGFTFSMALGRYDQRKNFEEAEANAIGTEFVRADLLPDAEAAQVRKLLIDYTDQRILFYGARSRESLDQVNARTATLQDQLWKAVKGPARAEPTPITALAVAGMNDVLNSQGYSQAAWWNRIPHSAWGLMFSIAVVSNLLIGIGSRSTHRHPMLFLILPLVLSIAFLLIADIDTPRAGLIHVVPQNLQALRGSLHP